MRQVCAAPLATWQGRRLANPANTVMNEEMCLKLLELVTLLDDESMLTEIHEQFVAKYGIEVDIRTICLAMAKLGFTRKRLHRLAIQCDQERASAFYSNLVLNYSANQLIFLDETSKDYRACNRNYGYALRGLKPRTNFGIFSRGERTSTLAAFDMNGFLDWYMVQGTFNSDLFLEGFQQAVLPYIQPYPGPRSVVVLDNASTHKRQSFVDAVYRKGGIVIWLPPYCWHLNPIEEGFGCVRQWLMIHKPLLQWQGIGGLRGMLALAFRSVSSERARRCFHSSGYV